jgi:hypothetical protein
MEIWVEYYTCDENLLGAGYCPTHAGPSAYPAIYVMVSSVKVLELNEKLDATRHLPLNVKPLLYRQVV